MRQSGSEDESQAVAELAAALHRMGNDRELFREVTAMIMEDFQEHLDGIHDAVNQEDWGELKNHSHALRGLVATYGTQDRLYQDLQALEDAAEAGAAEGIPALASRISAEMTGFVAKIQFFMESTGE